MRTAVRQTYKRILRKDQVMRLPSGVSMSLPRQSCFASEIALTRSDVDWGSERLLYGLLQRRGCLLDIGANIGYYSLYMSPRVEQVFAFEPDPRVLDALRRNAGRVANITVVPCALGSSVGRAGFTLERYPELSHLSSPTPSPGASAIAIEVDTIDSFAAGRQLAVEAIKIDCEGSDLAVLAGGLRVLADQRPIVLAEIALQPEIFRIAESLNYRLFAFVSDSRANRRRFLELQPDCAAPGATKMIFLLPLQLADRAQSVAAETQPKR